jgi:hypothetical protein
VESYDEKDKRETRVSRAHSGFMADSAVVANGLFYGGNVVQENSSVKNPTTKLIYRVSAILS